MTALKTCSGCGNVFPLESFGPKSHHADGSIRYYRSRCAICRAEGGIAERARIAWIREHGDPVDQEHCAMLPVEPWRVWLHRALGQVDDQASLAIRLDVDARRLYAWLNDGMTVHLDTVDRALCAYGDPGALRDIYPHLYLGPGFGDEAEAEELAA